MEDISRDKEEEERFPEREEEKSTRKKRVYNETLQEMDYSEYSENVQRDMDTILSSNYYKVSTSGKLGNNRKEVKSVRRYILDKILGKDGIPAKFNSSSTSSDVFSRTSIERDTRKRDSTVVYVKYYKEGNKGVVACLFDLSRDYKGDKLTIVNKKVYDSLKSDLEREVEEFKKNTFAGQVTERLESSSREIRRENEPSRYRPSLRDVDDAQNETIERMRVEFEHEKYKLGKELNESIARAARSEDDRQRVIKHNREVVVSFQKDIDEKSQRIKTLEDQLRSKSFSKFEQDEKNREIEELKAEVTKLELEKSALEGNVKYLRKDIDNYLSSIEKLENEVKTKQEKIETLEKEVSDLKQRKDYSQDLRQKEEEIKNLKKEIVDLKSQISRVNIRLDTITRDRDYWKKK